MNPFRKLFGKREKIPCTPAPDDTALKEDLAAAKKENTKATKKLLVAARKAERDAEFVRQVIGDVLARNDNVKHASHSGKN